jgi:hypothetical protein
MTFLPITPNWLTGAWDQFIAEDPELEYAYDYANYPSDMYGEGNWIDLYLTDSDEFPIGRLWINPETENIGLQALPQGNISYLTKIALELREFRHNGVDPLTAYEYIKRDYFAGEEQAGDLADAQARNQG